MIAKKSDKKIEAILRSLSQGSSIIKACKAVDINVATFWRWRQDDEKLNKEVESIIASRTQIVEDVLYMAAIKGNITAQIFWQKNRASDRWADKYDHSGKIDLTFKLLDVDMKNYPQGEKK